MIEIKSPARTEGIDKDKTKIFLAGSIEVGMAETWQQRVAAKIEVAVECLTTGEKDHATSESALTTGERNLTTDKFVLLNPRRDDWDSTWKQTRDDPQFRQQVTWELSSLRLADWILLYFDPATKSPISLLELGLYANSGKLVVVCPDGFWRKGNVDIVCDFYGIIQRDTLADACNYIVEQESLKK